MKKIRRSKRLRLPHRRQQLITTTTSDNDESDLEYEIFEEKSIVQSNKNANRISTPLFDTITNLPIKEKQHQILHSSSDQSSLLLYSINSMQKPITSIDDLTPLTITTTNTTPLTALTFSNTKQTETGTGTIKIDLTQLSDTDTLDSSPINNYHNQLLPLHREISSPNITNKIKNTKDIPQIYDIDTSMKSIVFSTDNSLKQELSYQKYISCFTIPSVGNGDCMTITSPAIMEGISLQENVNTNINTCHQSPNIWNLSRWNLKNMRKELKLLICCSSLGLIIGIVILVIII